MSARRILKWLLAPFHAVALLTGVKSFRDNPVLGNPTLNAKGLHVERKRIAHRMAADRRARLQGLVSEADAADFDREGFIVKTDFLPPEVFAALRDEALNTLAPARDTRQGDTVTRRIPLDVEGRRRLPAVAALERSPEFRKLLQYVGASRLNPQVFVQTIFSQVYAAEPDPQTELHADTFHPTVKAWFFLNDVQPDEGPFVYVPGSHKLNPRRAAFELWTSMVAANSPSFLTSRGSFRIDPEVIAAIHLPEPRIFAVPANTLIVADTGGFHARGQSARPSVRTEIFAYGRRSPFLPWTGLDITALPWVEGRVSAIGWAFEDLRQKLTGRWAPWQAAGEVTATQPPELSIHFDMEAVRREEEARAREAALQG